MNRVVLVGRITRDPELRTSPSGVPFVAFSLAVNRTMPNASGEREADFINCVAFNKQAENLSRFIKKGGQIGVDGKLQTRRYQAPDGSNRYATDVICDQIHFLEPKSTQQGSYNDYSSYEPAPQQRPAYQEPKQEKQSNVFDDVKSQFDITDDDLPF